MGRNIALRPPNSCNAMILVAETDLNEEQADLLGRGVTKTGNRLCRLSSFGFTAVPRKYGWSTNLNVFGLYSPVLIELRKCAYRKCG